MFYLAGYIALIAGVNYAFAYLPMLNLPWVGPWSPAELIVGFVFVARDFAQRKIGHHVLWAMLAGIGISWIMTTPQLALASAAAFAVSELSDWALYTFCKRPFSQRVLISSLLSAPVDSFVFLAVIDIVSVFSIIVMTISKLAGAFVVYRLLRRRERFRSAGEASPF